VLIGATQINEVYERVLAADVWYRFVIDASTPRRLDASTPRRLDASTFA